MPLRRLFAADERRRSWSSSRSRPPRTRSGPTARFQRRFAALGAVARPERCSRRRAITRSGRWPSGRSGCRRSTTASTAARRATSASPTPVMAGAPGAVRGASRRPPHTPAGFDRFGCTSCHGGQGPATSEGEAHGTAKDAGPPMLPVSYLEAGCGRCHAAIAVAGAPLLSRGRALMARYGCFACHGARGQRGLPLRGAAARRPSPVKTGGALAPPVAEGAAGGRPERDDAELPASSDDIEELANYALRTGRCRKSSPALVARRPRRSRPGTPRTARSSSPSPGASRATRWRERGTAPRPSSRRSPRPRRRGWLLAFVRDPHAFNPRTRDAAVPLHRRRVARRRRLHRGRVARFRRAEGHPRAAARRTRRSPRRARRLFRQYGCFSCHGRVRVRGQPRSSARPRRHRRQEGRLRSTSAGAPTCRGRSRPGSPPSSRRRAPSRRA